MIKEEIEEGNYRIENKRSSTNNKTNGRKIKFEDNSREARKVLMAKAENAWKIIRAETKDVESFQFQNRERVFWWMRHEIVSSMHKKFIFPSSDNDCKLCVVPEESTIFE